jgi:hypothetical protein
MKMRYVVNRGLKLRPNRPPAAWLLLLAASARHGTKGNAVVSKVDGKPAHSYLYAGK